MNPFLTFISNTLSLLFCNTRKKIIICNTRGKRQIQETLFDFDKEKTRGSTKKYQYADKITVCLKSDLETSKADIEFQIENDRTLAAFLALLVVLVSTCLLSSLPIVMDLKFIGAIIVLFFVALGISTWIKINRTLFWLHIIKIALARKNA